MGILGYLVVLLAAVLPYYPGIRHVDFASDDYAALYLVRHFDFSDLFDPALYSTAGSYGFFRPVGVVSWWVNYRSFGFNAVGYHFTNALLHGACAILVVVLGSALARDRKVGFLSGLVFAVAPVHSECIIWVSARYDPLAALFYILGLFCYLEYPSSGRGKRLLFAALAFEALAIMSKEMAVTFPLVLLLYEAFYHRENGHRFRDGMKRVSPFMALMVVYLFARAVFFHGLGGYRTVGGGSVHGVLVGFGILWRRLADYLAEQLFGFNLEFSYLRVILAMIGTAFAVLIAGLLNVSTSRKRLVVFLLTAMMVTFLPLINLTKLPEHPGQMLLNGRYLYLPSVFFFLAVSSMAVPDRVGVKFLRYAAGAGFAVLLVCYSIALQHNNNAAIYHSDEGIRILKSFVSLYPDGVQGSDVVVYNLPRESFGDEGYLPKNFKRALFFWYGERDMEYSLDAVTAPPGSYVEASPIPKEPYKRKVVLEYQRDKQRLARIFDSALADGPRKAR